MNFSRPIECKHIYLKKYKKVYHVYSRTLMLLLVICKAWTIPNEVKINMNDNHFAVCGKDLIKNVFHFDLQISFIRTVQFYNDCAMVTICPSIICIMYIRCMCKSIIFTLSWICCQPLIHRKHSQKVLRFFVWFPIYRSSAHEQFTFHLHRMQNCFTNFVVIFLFF